jgi:hypothetical protein
VPNWIRLVRPTFPTFFKRGKANIKVASGGTFFCFLGKIPYGKTLSFYHHPLP